ncbi:hypothetical protein PRIPAC_96003 [Pristionchus pacificus]|uniref:Glycoside hydrolase n=1 Tax=Pristionchus pacificus TaxID=54126 RepID=A0A454Y2X3_PRIPA|nr:hypothetical protein PRIPAC_96003 [Pristionchus pacificus]|eukprot:PDM84610.1 glycoside hydrolase [Pristionchus pacificus]
MIKRSLALLLSSLAVATATIGFDAEQPISTSTFTCLKSSGYSFYISRVHRSNGAIDSTGVTNIKNAWSGGLSHVDGYIFPCLSPNCPSATDQAINAVDALKNGGTKIGRMWIDVEVYNWPSIQSNNRQFILDMANKLVELGCKIGIYSNHHYWKSIVGTDWTRMSKYQLWWASYNGHADLNHFKAFGGWSKPSIHQYTVDVAGPCSVGQFDLNYKP